MTPLGNWWQGVTYASRGRSTAGGSLAGSSPPASTGTRRRRAPTASKGMVAPG